MAIESRVVSSCHSGLSLVCAEKNLSSEKCLLHTCLHWESHAVFGVFPAIEQGRRIKINWVLEVFHPLQTGEHGRVHLGKRFITTDIFTNCFHFLLGPGPCCLWPWLSAIGNLKTLSDHPLYLITLSLHPLLPCSHTRGDSSKAPRPWVSF